MARDGFKSRYTATMDRASIVTALRAHEPELRLAGVVSLSLFGSMARDEAEAGSDVDLVLRLDESLTSGGFAWFGRVADLRRRRWKSSATRSTS